ncbi:MAG: transposase [Candidatus Diapherotrites archaeon]
MGLPLLAFEYRLYPNRVQIAGLENSLELCRQAYNFLLEKLNFQSVQGKIDVGELQHSLVELKEKSPEFNGVYSKALQPECGRLRANLRSLAALKRIGRNVGKLRFKGREWFKTFSYNQSGFRLSQTKAKKGILELSKIGGINVKLHRPFDGRIKQVTLKNRCGKWYAIIITDAVAKRVCGDAVVGIDLGVNHFLVDSKGCVVAHPHNIDKYAEKMVIAQRNLARKKRGSKNRLKARLRVAKIHDNVLRARKDFLHKISSKYVAKCKTIVVEDLNIAGIVRSSYNARNVVDASWGRFLQMLCFKAESAGCRVVNVNPINTSRECCNCGYLKDMPLWQRTFKCDSCGMELDRDLNAAKNILYRFTGREPVLARELPSTQAIGQGGLMKQKAMQLKRMSLKCTNRFSSR